MKGLNYLLSILLLTILVGCNTNVINKNASSDNNDDNYYYEANDELRVLTEGEIEYIIKVEDEGTVLSFDGGTPQQVIPPKGQMFMVSMSEKTPYGFLGRTVDVVYDGDVILVYTESVALNEAFPNLSIDTVLDLFENVEGVFDENDEPVEFYIEEIEDTSATRAHAEFDWESKQLVIPMLKIESTDLEFVSNVRFSFKDSKFDLDNKDDLKYLNLTFVPKISVDAEASVELLGKEKEFESKKLYFKTKAVVGPGIVIPITIPIYFKCGVGGKITSTLSLDYSASCKAYLTYENEKWDYGCVSTSNSDQNPWVVSKFDFEGELYAGVSFSFIAGIFTERIGAGFNLFPRVGIDAEASLTSIDPFDFNPQAEISCKLESKVFCMAHLFNKSWKQLDINFPDAVFFRRAISLFPSFGPLEVTPGSLSAEIVYTHDSYYLLAPIVQTGTTLFASDAASELRTHYPECTRIDNQGIRHFEDRYDNLSSGETYYVAPTISLFDYKWFGEKEKIETEANYTFGFRCINHSYDVIVFNFSLNNTTGNVIDYTTEAADYDGDPMRVHITASYNSETKTLNGLLDFYFYDDPTQKRQDGFTVSLAGDDSGYVDCSKVIDNGGCYAALRIYKAGSTEAKARKYNYVLVEDDCGVGLCN